MQTNRFAALFLAAVLGLAAVGCGSSDGDDAASTTTKPDTTTTAATGEAGGDDAPADDDGTDAPVSAEKAAFLEAADKICKESTDAINQQSEGLDGEDFDDAAFEEFLAMAATESAKQIAAVRALGLPEDDAEELDRAFSAFEDAFAKVADDPANTLEYTSTPEFEEATAFMDDYGFHECGSDS